MPLILDIEQAKKLQRKKRIKRLRPVKRPALAEKLLRQKTEDLWRRVIFPSLERIKWAIQQGQSREQLTILLDQELQQAALLYDTDTETIVNMWRLAVDQMTRVKINAALHNALGIDMTSVFDEPEIREAMMAGAWEAESLIKTMPTKVMGQVADAVMKNMRGIPLPEGRSLLDQIDFLGTRSRKWAHLIARDQTSKLTDKINTARQQAIGIDVYRWVTMRDKRVVGNPNGQYPDWNDKHMDHYAMEGVYCKYDDPTVFSTDGGKTWRQRTGKMPKNHPTDDIMCRCDRAPIIDIDKLLARAIIQ
jgi:uncharacterized protein with gpF-like domain